jgi:hypothetical protein
MYIASVIRAYIYIWVEFQVFESSSKIKIAE